MGTADLEWRELEWRGLDLGDPDDRQQIDRLLERNGLQRDQLDYYIGLFSGSELVAGGGSFGRTIKDLAVEQAWRSEGLTNRLVSRLYSRLVAAGAKNVFIFSKPENAARFQSLGFTTVGSAPAAMLFESNPFALPDYLRKLRERSRPGLNGAIVVNCNPFTLGHQYLIETAAGQCDHLHIFVVSEERSVFPAEVRQSLVEQGTAHLPQVSVHAGGDYIISAATFPTYFLKQYSKLVQAHAALDIDIFARHIAPALQISRRFAGEEPLDPVTAAYNAAMLAILPGHGVEVRIIPRICQAGQPISASLVRSLIIAGKLEETRALLPATTYNYLLSAAAQPVLEKIRSMSMTAPVATAAPVAAASEITAVADDVAETQAGDAR